MVKICVTLAHKNLELSDKSCIFADEELKVEK